MRSTFAVLIACWLVSAAPGSAAARGPSTAEERAKALELVDLLETNPAAPEAKEARKWLILWIGEIPDLTVSYCLEILGSDRDLDKIPSDLKVHPLLSQTAHLLRHPEAENGTPETFLAGVEGTLRAYGAMKTAGLVAEVRPLEDLKREQAAGELEKTVRKRVMRCGGP